MQLPRKEPSSLTPRSQDYYGTAMHHLTRSSPAGTGLLPSALEMHTYLVPRYCQSPWGAAILELCPLILRAECGWM
jgi:hypothetical protein